MTLAPSRHEVTVAADPATAHDCFARHMGDWWPQMHTVGTEPKDTVIVEPALGGGVFERGVEGTELRIGTVTAWDPPRALAVSWQITPDWRPEPDIDRASEYHVTFVADGDATRVTVVHDGFDRHGPGGAAVKAAVDADLGWPLVLESYRTHLATVSH